MNLISVTPNARFSNLMFMSDSQLQTYLKYNNFFNESFYAHELCNTDQHNINHYDNCLFFKKSFVYIVTETVAEYPYPYLTEKTWKSFFYKMPFMLVGSKDSLAQLKSFGFKTFEDFWDESYDKLEFASDRIDKIVENLKILSMLDQNQIDNLYKKMLPIVNYNQTHLEKFYQTQFNTIIKKLENL